MGTRTSDRHDAGPERGIVLRIAPQASLGLYSSQVEDMMYDGVPFEDLEQAIQATELTDDEKAALWLLAWSLEIPTVEQRRARATLALMGGEARSALAPVTGAPW
jgi:hypothetical protein